MIDLHMHSTFSDGSYTPEELVQEAVSLNLKAIALTDHDTVNGLPRFLQAAARAGPRAIPGVEISTSFSPGTMHVLGYFIDMDDRALREQLDAIKDGRAVRNEEILVKLNELGLALTWEDIKKHAGEEVIGRPHFAQAMIEKGYAADKQEVFDAYLAKGKPAYVARRTLSPESAIALIRSSGGLPVLAHPYQLGLDSDALRTWLSVWREQGLKGIEVYYARHTPEMQKEYLAYAQAFDLVPTGGTDFHGTMSPGISMGSGLGALAVPDTVLDALEKRRQEAQK